jgi:hypothetical protein
MGRDSQRGFRVTFHLDLSVTVTTPIVAVPLCRAGAFIDWLPQCQSACNCTVEGQSDRSKHQDRKQERSAHKLFLLPKITKYSLSNCLSVEFFYRIELHQLIDKKTGQQVSRKQCPQPRKTCQQG